MKTLFKSSRNVVREWSRRLHVRVISYATWCKSYYQGLVLLGPSTIRLLNLLIFDDSLHNLLIRGAIDLVDIAIR
jgi:hypothetical protein